MPVLGETRQPAQTSDSNGRPFDSPGHKRKANESSLAEIIASSNALSKKGRRFSRPSFMRDDAPKPVNKRARFEPANLPVNDSQGRPNETIENEAYVVGTDALREAIERYAKLHEQRYEGRKNVGSILVQWKSVLTSWKTAPDPFNKRLKMPMSLAEEWRKQNPDKVKRTHDPANPEYDSDGNEPDQCGIPYVNRLCAHSYRHTTGTSRSRETKSLKAPSMIYRTLQCKSGNQKYLFGPMVVE
ncbi:hypothetical protein PG993_006154 [Apiospora rasikravindrae]|uniref:Uncharacterized protein n=1 Tax=Apiospora rasikravindrae TaxID=990691 RepID=A0ABR1T6J8_9PEZI